MSPTFDHDVRGVEVGPETRCAHYHTDRDVIAIRFPCCDTYYPCFECHESETDHDPERWPRSQFGEPAVLCGVCGTELTIETYLGCDHHCPACDAAFNPGCANHYDLYFETDG